MNIKINKHEYIEQLGCHMCKRKFEKREYDCQTEYYCTFEAEPRPKCGSVLMDGENYSGEDDYEEGGDFHKWNEWAKKNRVNPWGICRKFEEE